MTPEPQGGASPDRLYINPEGPSLRVVNAGHMGGPPQAQLVPADKPLTVTAGQIGQVFAIALDDAMPPNIYAAATSAYGLPIVVPDADGDGRPDRARIGAPNAMFMPGLFGPDPGAGPGTIWKISGVDGTVSLFANVTLDGVPNSGPALGGLAFDPASRQIFVADRDTGMIHAFTLDGRESGRFDHGVEGLAAVGLPPLPFDPRKRLDIQSPAFDSTNAATWQYPPLPRRIFGLAVHRDRLYYAVAAGSRVWSVSIGPGGGFGADARVELVAPGNSVPGAEISKIVFDDAGAMVLAERGTPTGAYDFGALTAAGSGRVLRFEPKQPGAEGTPFFWKAAGEYAIGFPPDHRNGDGGVAIGYGYDADGFTNIGACGGTLWTTGSRLRVSPDPVLVQRLAPGGPFPVDGLQANAVSLLRPQNVPPLSAYFIDFDEVTTDAAPGHMGDVAAWRFCPPAFYPQIAELLLEESFCPAGSYFRGNRCVPATCHPNEFYRAGQCEKPECVPGSNLRDPMCCTPRKKWNPRTQRCEDPPPRQPDLAIRKLAVRCGASGPCTFQLVVSNVGDVPYNGPIAVGDQVTPGQVTSITPPSAGWQCASYPSNIFACSNPDVTLQPNQMLVFTVQVNIPATLRGGWQNCGAVAGDKAKEANWGNNKSCVKHDGDKPTKPDGKPDLKVVKAAPAACSRVSGTTYRCEFTINVTNDGTADLAGEVVVSDITQTGRLVEVGGGNWNCQVATPLTVCRNPGGLRAGETQSFRAVVEVEAGPEGRQVTNCIYPEEIVRRGMLPGSRRLQLAASEVPPGLLRQLAQGPTPGAPSNGPGSGAAPPSPPASPSESCATVVIPPESAATGCGPGTIEVRDPSGRPRCCTPESLAAGTCGPTTVDRCPAPGTRIGNLCCTPEQIRRGLCPSPPTIVETCASPNVKVGTLCCTPEQLRGGACIPPPAIVDTCLPPNVRVGSRCCSPAQIRDRTCGPPPTTVSCPAGQFRGDDGKCHTRPGKGETDKGRSCKAGFTWTGKRCEPIRTKPRCERGRIDAKGNCVTPGKKPPPKKTIPGSKQKIVTPPPRRPAPPAQPVPGSTTTAPGKKR